MLSTKQRLICLAVFAAMTTACSTGSGLSASTAPSTTNVPGNGGAETPSNKFKTEDLATSAVVQFNTVKEGDDSSEEPAPEPEYGHTQPAPISGYLYYKEGGSPDYIRDRNKVDPSQAQIDSAENYDTIAFTNTKPRDESKIGQSQTREVNINKKHWEDNADTTPLSNWGSDYALKFSGEVPEEIQGATTYLYANSKDAVAGTEYLKLFELENTKIGMVSEDVDWNNYANIFYKAKNPSELIPAAGTATYQGLWDLVRDLPGEKADLQQTSIGYGNNNEFSAAKFEVNFANKSLTGKLAPRTSEVLGQDREFAYDISANIQGNRFTGNATPSNTEEGYKNELRDATVQGGFFGEQASELAGTIQNTEEATDANKDKPGFFGVFAAKQTDSTGIKDGEPVPEVIYNKSGAANFNSDSSVFVTSFEDVLANTTKLPNVNTITLNGVEINLLTEAGKEHSNVFTSENNSLPLQFTRIGKVLPDETNPLLTYFYQGQLTQTMPTTGSATYEGNWIGGGVGDGAAGKKYLINKDHNATINFMADFGSKTLSGMFMTPAGTPAMTLNNDVKIVGNTFAGTADITAHGLTNDKVTFDGSVKGSVDLSGGFFGDNANELGGQFNKADNSFAGVFAGKQTK